MANRAKPPEYYKTAMVYCRLFSEPCCIVLPLPINNLKILKCFYKCDILIHYTEFIILWR